MRNLKKFLALFLAMVMAMSLMLTANAAGFDSYEDKGEIDPAFSEAVEVLTGLKVLGGDDRGFGPKRPITRAEVAAVIYRIATGDVTDAQVKVYADYGNYVDVKPDAWYAGYVGYCTNAGYIKGEAGNRFNPSGNVTGYQALAMILRAVGYDKNKEFEGASWQVNVAALSKQLGVTQDVINANFETTLNYEATREVIADLLFMTITTVPTVTYTPALAYNDKDALLGLANRFNPTLGQKIFGLYVDTSWSVIDEWGRPGYEWHQGGTATGTYTTDAARNGLAYVVPANHPIYGGGTSVVATIEGDYTKRYEVAKLECEVADDLGISTARNFKLFVNGTNMPTTAGVATNGAVDDTYRIEATDTVTKVGGQGRVTEFYTGVSSRWAGTCPNICVMYDTMLAQVTTVTPAKLDPAGHVMVPAKMEVTIYDGGMANAPAGNNGNSKRIISKPTNSKAEWDFSKGDMILIHAYTNKTARTTQTDRESAAFQTDAVVGIDNPTTTLFEGDTVWIAKSATNTTGKAPSFTGKQTLAYWNASKHQVDGKDYEDQLCLFLDRAGRATNTTFTWWQDNYGNIIGITDAIANFGVIQSIYAAFGQGESDTNGRVKAMASVKFSDGSVRTVAIDKFLMSCKGTANAPTVPSTANQINTVANTQLTAGANTVELWPRYDSDTHKALMVSAPTIPMSDSNDAVAQGFLYLAPSTVTNNDAHFATGSTPAAPVQDTYGILFDHMFEFVVASDDTVVAIEVAGSTVPATPNEGLYAGLYNNTAGTTPNEGKIFKGLSIMVLSNTNAGVGTAGAINTVYLDDSTQIMVYDGNRIVNTYPGVNALPGDVTIATGSQVDWADTDGDGRANYVYVTGTIPGVVTYNLFYYDGTAAQWNGTTGTIQGYLNGKLATVTFNDLSMFNTVNNSINYEAHLFALQITNGVVTNVMQAENMKGNQGQLILADYTTAGVPVNTSGTVLDFDSTPAAGADDADNIRVTGTWATADKFQLGAKGSNTYTVNTEAVYWHDSVLVNGTLDNVSYERVSQGHKIVVSGGNSAEYWIAPNCDIIGELDWLNMRECEVTIVYENNTANSAIQVYISTDLDVTPSSRPTNTIATRPYGSDVVYVTNAAGMVTALTTGTPNIVLYCETAKPTDGEGIQTALGITTAASDPKNLIYFPFQAPVGIRPQLTIRDEDGDLVYSETFSAATTNDGLGTGCGDSHAFVVDFQGGNPGTQVPGKFPLYVGMTYTFQVTYVTATGIVTLSSGSFGMN